MATSKDIYQQKGEHTPLRALWGKHGKYKQLSYGKYVQELESV